MTTLPFGRLILPMMVFNGWILMILTIRWLVLPVSVLIIGTILYAFLILPHRLYTIIKWEYLLGSLTRKYSIQIPNNLEGVISPIANNWKQSINLLASHPIM